MLPFNLDLSLDVVDSATIIGIDANLGADEDDFHSFKRRKSELERREKQDENTKRNMNVEVGAASGPAAISKPKKVVHFP